MELVILPTCFSASSMDSDSWDNTHFPLFVPLCSVVFLQMLMSDRRRRGRAMDSDRIKWLLGGKKPMEAQHWEQSQMAHPCQKAENPLVSKNHPRAAPPSPRAECLPWAIRDSTPGPGTGLLPPLWPTEGQFHPTAMHISIRFLVLLKVAVIYWRTRRKHAVGRWSCS